MKEVNIKELVKGTTATFQRYTDGKLWYKVNDFEFPIPIEDTKGAVFNAEEKGMTLMRWMRKHIELMKSEGEDE
ncbi:MAG: hypothetical protein CL489_10290 [Acidobacteria bacterium]|nr:hypothetical protein [Acidobacteriota bacterium]|tara:strand:+ start:9875 stop:10096 length:222 start_codon:yes stop_codon:yes gene_type:complete